MAARSGAKLDWDRDGGDWPNRDASRFVSAAGIRWHVQEMGDGPVLLLLHGTGASTHSWREVMPRLASRFRVIAPDLPGHGFTDALPPRRLTLPGMAAAIAGLLATLGAKPAMLVGHSAGAAIAIRMALDGLAKPAAIVSINGALFPFRSVAGPVFETVAKLLALNPVVPWLVATRARSGGSVDRLLRGTGSSIDDHGATLYRRLARSPSHVAGALGMMAGWDLNGLSDDLPRLDVPLLLIVGGDDAMVPPERAFEVRDRVRRSRVVYLRRLGHLAHEQAPAEIAALVERSFDEAQAPGEVPHG
jgi:magnesium chelatase accessory protein